MEEQTQVETTTAPVLKKQPRKQSGISRAINRPIDLMDDVISLVENGVGIANDILIFGRGQIHMQMQMDKVEMREDLTARGLSEAHIDRIINDLPY